MLIRDLLAGTIPLDQIEAFDFARESTVRSTFRLYSVLPAILADPPIFFSQLKSFYPFPRCDNKISRLRSVNIVLQSRSRDRNKCSQRKVSPLMNAVARDRRNDRVSQTGGRTIARISRRFPLPSERRGGCPYGGLPQQFRPIVITLESSPASAPSRRRKAGPISTLPIEWKLTRVAA